MGSKRLQSNWQGNRCHGQSRVWDEAGNLNRVPRIPERNFGGLGLICRRGFHAPIAQRGYRIIAMVNPLLQFDR